MELEAGLIAYELLIGTDNPANIDTTCYQQFEAGDLSQGANIFELASLVVAPFLFFTIDFLAQRTASSFDPKAGSERTATHPSIIDRIKQIIPLLKQVPPHTASLFKYALALKAIGDILEQDSELSARRSSLR